MLKVADVYSFIFLIWGWLSTNSTLYFPPSFVSGNYIFFLNSCLAIVLSGYHDGFPNTKNCAIVASVTAEIIFYEQSMSKSNIHFNMAFSFQALTSTALKKGGLSTGDVAGQYKYKNTLIDVKIETASIVGYFVF